MSAIIAILTIYSIIPNKNYKILEKLADYSFGIYLLHSPLIYLTFCFYPNIHPFLMVFINFIVFGTICTILVKFIKKTKIKFVIGE